MMFDLSDLEIFKMVAKRLKNTSTIIIYFLYSQKWCLCMVICHFKLVPVTVQALWLSFANNSVLLTAKFTEKLYVAHCNTCVSKYIFNPLAVNPLHVSQRYCIWDEDSMELIRYVQTGENFSILYFSWKNKFFCL